MGIPSYFSQLVKNNPGILFDLEKLKIPVDNFYLDCNSIVYDTIRRIEHNVQTNLEQELMKSSCEQILSYIETISPRHCVFVAFDGVAPVAKLEQQRNRRFKSRYEKNIAEQLGNATETWDTAKITPGTQFMSEFAKYVKNFFKTNPIKDVKLIISTSEEEGEGEHKLYEHIRSKDHSKETTLIYGVDADLIMLSLNHIHLCKHIYLYRETPFFIKSLDSGLEPDKCYILDIPRLSRVISSRLGGKRESTRDYIFMCFLLGNDFLPHFPSLNIRTRGIDILSAAYSEIFKNKPTGLTNGTSIHWTGLNRLIAKLAEMEEDNLKDEYRIRSRWEKRTFATKTIEDKLTRLSHLPTQLRDIEKYICPEKQGWRERYYSELLDTEPSDYYISRICTNYLEGLEWTFKYYTEGCYDWRWKYQYCYAPLFKDLLKYVPKFDVNVMRKKAKDPISPSVQLAYVLPNEAAYLLNDKVKAKVEELKVHPSTVSFKWAFCKYFWEAHMELPHIDVSWLEKEINSIEQK